MLRVKYSHAASNYFFDNGEVVFRLHYVIESLVFTEGKPQEGSVTALPGNMFVWELMEHTVIYSIDDEAWITIRFVIPD